MLEELMNKLAGEAVLLEPNNLASCGRMLTLLDQIDHPDIIPEKNELKKHLEAMIMKDLDGSAPGVDEIVAVVMQMQRKLRDGKSGGSKSTAAKKTKPKQADKDATPVADKVPVAEAVAGEVVVNDEIALKQAKVDHEVLSLVEEDMIDDADLVSEFISEAREHLDSIDLNMVEWEKDTDNTEIINSIFRPFHTIKGVSAFLNLKVVNHLAHQLENLLDDARGGRIGLSPELSDIVFDGVDVLKSLISSVEIAVNEKKPVVYEVDVHAYLDELDAVMAGVLGKAGKAADSDDDVAENGKIKKITHRPLGEILVSEGKVKPDELNEVLKKQESAGKHLGELLISEKKVSARDVSSAIRQQQSEKQQVDKFIKVDTSKMDQLLNMVGELVIAQSMVTHNPQVSAITDQRFARDISQLTRVTSTLQNISMSMRMVPIGQTFQKMNRIVRDLARKSGKKINLVLQGQSAEIDRNMVEELYDPLVHMIRNSCDHGIKQPEERVSKGKTEEGTITLSAAQSGGKITITITDDGEGLDRHSILAKAREKGLIGPNDKPDDREIDNMIFMAGFSTAKQVTDVSGRGVGMDVVRRAIERLRGTVEISSITGEGTIFSIKLPLTTAIIDGMLVNVGEERYIIPTLSVRQLLHPGKKDINTVAGKGETVMVRGKLLPLVKLGEVLRARSAISNPWEAVLVIVEDGAREVAFQVDSVIGKQEVVIKSIGDRFNGMQGISGGAIMGDGKVGLILDVRSIIELKMSSPHNSIQMGD